ncbi:MAG: hypothetical protein CMJ64_10320 [Planctomycetaceae bacterium]|nr:hypothetical protein [Planctomycetaceae bacterium]
MALSLLAFALTLCSVSFGHCAEELAGRLRPLIANHEGDVAVAIRHLETGEAFQHDGGKVMPTASLIKFPVMVEAYRQSTTGEADLDSMIELRDEDRVPGSGILTNHFSSGARLSLRDAIRLMIVYSDNTATNLVLDRIGLKSTADTMQTLGFLDTKIHAKVFRRDTSLYPQRSSKYGLGSTTAIEAVRLYELLHKRRLITAEASDAMLDHLLHCDDRRKLAAMLPTGTEIAHKGGAVSRVRCDAGIIYSPSGPIAICVLTANNQDRSWGKDNAAEQLCARIAKTAYDHFNPAGNTDVRPLVTELRQGSSGELVEALQRTLNKRLTPSPMLDIDGDFGPVTEAAVIRFQAANDLKQTGVMTKSTWESLGPLQMQDDPVSSPDVVNTQTIEKTPPGELDGPPHVTCKAWAIGDAATGDPLWQHDADSQLDIASTTKIMTAYIVFTLAERDASVLDETVIFSQRADDTPGSTAGIRVGERLPVRELLYGLLLPSGNDASVALAEHFGRRLSKSKEDSEDIDPLDHFIAEMNRTAERVGMKLTHFENPHGLTAAGHQSSASDLLRLASASMKLPDFRDYVGTKQRGCTVIGAGGYVRNVKWVNTNKLLSTEGYVGVKTGTTRAAGACLVSCERRGDEELIVIVLGAQSSGARYVDARNLFRFAWRERGGVE